MVVHYIVIRDEDGNEMGIYVDSRQTDVLDAIVDMVVAGAAIVEDRLVEQAS